MMELGQPRLKGMLFGSGLWATMIDCTPPYVNRIQDLDVEMVRFLIVPSPILKAVHNIKDKDLIVPTNEGNAQWREYPLIYVNILNESPSYGVILIDCDYNGGDTVLTRKHEKLYQKFMDAFARAQTFQDSWIISEEEKRQMLVYWNEYMLRTQETRNILKINDVKTDEQQLQGAAQK